MLVIVSDLHLTDGTVSETVSPEAVRRFVGQLRAMAEAASWRCDGGYRPVEQVDIVLLGDVLDLLHSSRWTAGGDVRPWDRSHPEELAEQVSRITAELLAHNEAALSELRALAAEGGLRVPPGLRAGRPAATSEEHPVAVRLHYLVGDHDWFLHVPGASFAEARTLVVRALGLRGRGEQPFPHEMTDADELLAAMRRHKVAARHGDCFDPLAFEEDRGTASLTDALVIELAVRFAVEIEQALAEELPAAAVAAIRELDHVHPLAMMPAWLEGVLERTCPQPAQRRRLKAVWDGLVEDLLALDFVGRAGPGRLPGLADALRRALAFGHRPRGDWAAANAAWLADLRGAAAPSYVSHALAEPDFRNRRARHVVFGHTHQAECLPLEASHAEAFVLSQIYFNAGTWRRVYRPTQVTGRAAEFVGAETIGCLAFYQGDERGGRPFETWSATLGLKPLDVAVHRIDSGKASHASREPHSSSGHGHAPHFSAGTAATRRVSARRQ